MQNRLTGRGSRGPVVALVTAAILGMVVGAILSALIKPGYTSTAQVIAAGGGSQSSAPRAATYAQLATSAQLAAKVKDELKLSGSTDDVRGRIDAQVAGASDVIEIDASGATPAAARDLCKAVISALQDLVAQVDPTGNGADASLSTASQPTLPTSTDSRHWLRNILLGLLVGLVLGAVIALLLALRKRPVRSETDVRRVLDAPVLGEVGLTGAPLLAGSPADKQGFATLRDNVRFLGVDTQGAVIVVTGPAADLPLAEAAVGMAQSVASGGARVLLVDGDLRRGPLTALLGLPADDGLSSVLLGDTTVAAAVQTDPETGLAVLTSGPLPPNPAELTGSVTLRSVLADARQTYRTIVVVAPDLASSDDAVRLAMSTDGALLVVRRNRASQQQLRSAVRAITAAGGRVFGVVIGDVAQGRAARDAAAGAAGAGLAAPTRTTAVAPDSWAISEQPAQPEQFWGDVAAERDVAPGWTETDAPVETAVETAAEPVAHPLAEPGTAPAYDDEGAQQLEPTAFISRDELLAEPAADERAPAEAESFGYPPADSLADAAADLPTPAPADVPDATSASPDTADTGESADASREVAEPDQALPDEAVPDVDGDLPSEAAQHDAADDLASAESTHESAEPVAEAHQEPEIPTWAMWPSQPAADTWAAPSTEIPAAASWDQPAQQPEQTEQTVEPSTEAPDVLAEPSADPWASAPAEPVVEEPVPHESVVHEPVVDESVVDEPAETATTAIDLPAPADDLLDAEPEPTSGVDDVVPAAADYPDLYPDLYADPPASGDDTPAVDSEGDSPAEVGQFDVEPAVVSDLTPALGSGADPAVDAYVDPDINPDIDPGIDPDVDPEIDAAVAADDSSLRPEPTTADGHDLEPATEPVAGDPLPEHPDADAGAFVVDEPGADVDGDDAGFVDTFDATFAPPSPIEPDDAVEPAAEPTLTPGPAAELDERVEPTPVAGTTPSGDVVEPDADHGSAGATDGTTADDAAVPVADPLGLDPLGGSDREGEPEIEDWATRAMASEPVAADTSSDWVDRRGELADELAATGEPTTEEPTAEPAPDEPEPPAPADIARNKPPFEPAPPVEVPDDPENPSIAQRVAMNLRSLSPDDEPAPAYRSRFRTAGDLAAVDGEPASASDGATPIGADDTVSSTGVGAVAAGDLDPDVRPAEVVAEAPGLESGSPAAALDDSLDRADQTDHVDQPADAGTTDAPAADPADDIEPGDDFAPYESTTTANDQPGTEPPADVIEPDAAELPQTEQGEPEDDPGPDLGFDIDVDPGPETSASDWLDRFHPAPAVDAPGDPLSAPYVPIAEGEEPTPTFHETAHELEDTQAAPPPFAPDLDGDGPTLDHPVGGDETDPGAGGWVAAEDQDVAGPADEPRSGSLLDEFLTEDDDYDDEDESGGFDGDDRADDADPAPTRSAEADDSAGTDDGGSMWRPSRWIR